MNRILAAIVILGLVVCPAWAKTKNPSGAKPGKGPQAKASPPPESLPPFQAYMVAEATTGQMIAGENIHIQRPPASITKLMLALIVMEKIEAGQVSLADTVSVSKEAAGMGGSQVYLDPKESFTLEEMMQAVLVASGNDAAYAVAEFIAGSRDAFVRMMNEKAASLGMADTVFQSPHGLPPSEGMEPDLTSCNDLVLLARALLKFPIILEWASIQTAPFRNGELIMRSHNRLLGRMTGVDGLKTGYYRLAGYSIVATAERNGLRLIAVVMGSPTAKIRDQIAEENLKVGFARCEMVTVVKKDEPLGEEIGVVSGKQKTFRAVAGESFAYPVLRDKKDLLKTEVVLPEKIRAEIVQGQPVGEVVVRLGEEVVGKVPVVSPVHIERSGFFSRFFN